MGCGASKDGGPADGTFVPLHVADDLHKANVKLKKDLAEIQNLLNVAEVERKAAVTARDSTKAVTTALEDSLLQITSAIDIACYTLAVD
jgi:hypothetical protein